MTRWVSTANAANAATVSICMVTLVDLNFASGTLYLHDALGTLSYGGNSYSGLGDYGRVDSLEESTETIARTIVLTLAGVPSTLLTDAMTENYQGKVVTLRVGLLDINSLAWIDNPEIIWEGRMDYMTVTLGQGTAQIQMRCEHRLNKEPPVARYTDQDQQLAHPGDTFFDLTWQIPLANASWGSITVQHPQNIPPTGRSSGTHPGFGPPGSNLLGKR